VPESRVCLYDSDVRRALAVLASLALAVTGAQLAHTLAYRLAEPNAHERAHLLSESGHAYLRFASAGLGLLAAIVVLSLVLEVRAIGVGARRTHPRLWGFAAIAPATFVFQEHFERLLHDGASPWGAALEQTFLLGLVLQLPFALLAYAAARLLLGAARGIAALLRRPRLARGLRAARRALLPIGAPHSILLRSTLGPRGPPSLRSF
jgi:hypothetical protein